MNEHPLSQETGQANASPAFHAAGDAPGASDARYRHLIESLRIGIVVSGADGIVRLSNRLALDLAGEGDLPSLNRALSSDARTWFDPDGNAVPPASYPINRARRERRSIRGEILGYDDRRTGRRTWLMIDAEPEFDAGGDLECVITSFSNVTGHIDDEKERQLMAQAVSESRRLESLGSLAGGVAHDFNNLLTGVLANAELALQEIPPGAPARPSVEQIIDAAGRATTLARRMLAYSGRASVVITSVDLNVLLEDVAAMVRPSIPEHIAVEQVLATGLPAVSADPTQLADLLANLLSNAADAIGQRDGRITVSSGIVDATVEYFASSYLSPALTPGPYAYFEVSDSGEGIAEAIRGRVFEPFFTTRFTGRGLGLSAAVGLVRAGQGAVQVDSEPGKGARFRITLPFAPGAAPVGRRTVDDDPPATARTAVLIADDEDTVLNVASRALELAGYQPVLATNGREAVDLFSSHRDEICAVVLDVTMPGLDGREALGLIRLIAPRVPAVIMSGYALTDLGFDEPNINAVFLQKPFVIGELRAAVRAAVEGDAGAAEPPVHHG